MEESAFCELELRINGARYLYAYTQIPFYELVQNEKNTDNQTLAERDYTQMAEPGKKL